MTEQNEPLQTLNEIRSMMERSSRFISLSGASGIFAGIFALAGVAAAYAHFKLHLFESEAYYQYAYLHGGIRNNDFLRFFIIDAGTVLILSLLIGILLTQRQARRKGLKVWDNTSRRMLLNLAMPLAAGGAFCVALYMNGNTTMGFVVPATLLFYGMALFNAGKYTLNDVRYLGLLEMGLGIVASFFLKHGLIFWGLGFGVLHIIYGVVMYYKYER